MVYMPQDWWNTLFGWMSPKQCLLPEGCVVPVQGVLVYVGVIVFIAVIVYWFREDIVETALSLWERIPHPFS